MLIDMFFELRFRNVTHFNMNYKIFSQIDLSYYELFGSLKVVLLNSSKLPAKQEVSSIWQGLTTLFVEKPGPRLPILMK